MLKETHIMRRLTFDDIYDPDKKIQFDGPPQPDVIWIDDDYFIHRNTDPKTKHTDWLKVHAASGAAEPLFDTSTMGAALKQLPGITDEDARRLAHLPEFVISPDRSAVRAESRERPLLLPIRLRRSSPSDNDRLA